MRISDWSSDVCSSDLTHVAQRQGQTNICRDGSPRQQRVALSHVADYAVDSLQRLSDVKNRAVCWREQAGDQVHRGRLAAHTWAQENSCPSLFDRTVDTEQNLAWKSVVRGKRGEIRVYIG